MKKVNLISKKIMSAGLAASLLVTSLGNTSCFAENPKPAQSVSTQQNNEKSGNIKATVKVQVINNSDKSKKESSEKKVVPVKDKNESKKSLKKAFDITKRGLISAFLIYACYKNGKDIVNCSKECWNFILENKENFKAILNGGVTAIKGLGNTITGFAKLIWEMISFAAKHTEASKNILATVGTYGIYNSLKNKINNFINKKDNKAENTFKIEGIFKKK